ncbi:MAG TPA: alpha/beta hydrolase family protein [Mycobacteriales bacterium]|jgi:S-formylglutathione hydrolase FrmB|nr:alpha/beta hydrolase family protein [Mycobacteriales bacterium]
MRVFVRRLVAAAFLLAAVVVPVTTASSATSGDPQFAGADGLQVLDVQQLDTRSYDVSVLSADLGRPVHIRVLLPAAYADNPDARYPVLYLFHGTSGRASDWMSTGDAEATTAPYDVITVMPECGFNGDGGFWFTDWVDKTTSHGPSQFESYLIDQLVPWVDDNLRTIPARSGRAVAGLSQGGYGAAEMAARHPDLFTVMASFSGAPEIDRDPDVIVGATGVIEAIAVGDDNVPPGSIFGSRATDEINWQGHDPSTLMNNLRGMGIYLWTGLGAPGPYDPTPPDPSAMGIEFLVHQSTQHFHQHLTEAGIPHFYDDYTDGTHSWGYWARDLRAFMAPMMAAFANPTTPDTISYTSIDQSWEQWGWSVSWARSAAQQFSTLDNARADGFSLTGAGDAHVVTPALYLPGETVTVTVQPSSGGSASTTTATADGSGRLALDLSFPDGASVSTSIVRIQRG